MIELGPNSLGNGIKIYADKPHTALHSILMELKGIIKNSWT